MVKDCYFFFVQMQSDIKSSLETTLHCTQLWICKLFSSHLHIKTNVFQKSLKIKAQQKRVLDKRKDNMV